MATNQWSDLGNYKGLNWEDYLSSPPIQLFSGTYIAQLAQTLLFARSFSSPEPGYKFALPIKVAKPFTQSIDVTGFYLLPNMETAENIIPGGEYKKNTTVLMFWESSEFLAYQKFTLKDFNLSYFNPDSAFFDYYQQGLSNIPSGGIIFDKIREIAVSWMANKLGVWRPGPLTVIKKSYGADNKPGGVLDNVPGYRGNGNTKPSGKKANIAPWILAAIAASQIIG